ncbi:unnamed protein product [Notodromas monacha]|uniref:Protein kinase domain-containing protein n=1 Tax=Notodromas monacha TaxID=399045 RepID=A0A7R9GD34_9CRUS|nr:unnamed protein product [Notodromas monacha]CAG0916741.1 unnamed protein product [Notodromas monacha]
MLIVNVVVADEYISGIVIDECLTENDGVRVLEVHSNQLDVYHHGIEDHEKFEVQTMSRTAFCFLAECSDSPVFRRAVFDHWTRGRQLSALLDLRISELQDSCVGGAWSRRLQRLVNEQIEVDYLASWLSTLGGAFSALGDSLAHCAEIAGKISRQQHLLACWYGDRITAAKCRIFHSISLMQGGKFLQAKQIIRSEYAFAKSLPVNQRDKRLENMCLGVWAKLRNNFIAMVIGCGNALKGMRSSSTVKVHCKKEKLKHRFEIIRKLGEGTCGKVQLGLNRETGQQVAVKIIKKSKIQTDEDLIRIRREIQIMSSVRHPSIIPILEVFENKDKIVLVMEYAAGGELYDYIVGKCGLLEPDARRIFRQIAAAVYYCHKHNICHRDLKLENVLMDENGNAKIADFGLSNVFDEKRKLTTYCGSPLYASPEVVKGVPYTGPEIDCWSLGVMLYTLVYSAMPFDGSNFKRLVKQITTGDFKEPGEKSGASDLIKGMLTPDPTKRLKIDQICSHSWVNEGYEVSCLNVANELVKQTPVRLGLLLSLAPSPKSCEKLVVNSDEEDESLSLSTVPDDEPPPLTDDENSGTLENIRDKFEKELSEEKDNPEPQDDSKQVVSSGNSSDHLQVTEDDEDAQKTPTPFADESSPFGMKLAGAKTSQHLPLVGARMPSGIYACGLSHSLSLNQTPWKMPEEHPGDKTPTLEKSMDTFGSPENVPIHASDSIASEEEAVVGPEQPSTSPSQTTSPAKKKSSLSFSLAPVDEHEEPQPHKTKVISSVSFKVAPVKLAEQLGFRTVQEENRADDVCSATSRMSSKMNEAGAIHKLPVLHHSPRECIIPIALEEGGYAPTPSSSVTSIASESSTSSRQTRSSSFQRISGNPDSLRSRVHSFFNDDNQENSRHLVRKSSEGNEHRFGTNLEQRATTSRYRRYASTLSASSLDDAEDVDKLNAAAIGSRPRLKLKLEKRDSVSSTDDEDDDDFEILSADSLFNSMLARVRGFSRTIRSNDDHFGISRNLGASAFSSSTNSLLGSFNKGQLFSNCGFGWDRDEEWDDFFR